MSPSYSLANLIAGPVSSVQPPGFVAYSLLPPGLVLSWPHQDKNEVGWPTRPAILVARAPFAILECAVCSIQCSVFSVQCAVFSDQCSVFSVLYITYYTSRLYLQPPGPDRAKHSDTLNDASASILHRTRGCLQLLNYPLRI